MSRAKKLLEEIEGIEDNTDYQEHNIIKAMQDKLDSYGILLKVDSAEYGDDNDVVVVMHDDEDAEYVLSFINDEKDGPMVLILDDEDKDGDDDIQLSVRVGQLNPALITMENKEYINITDLSWLDEDTLLNILSIAGIDFDIDDKEFIKYDAFGNIIKKDESIEELKEGDEITEIFKTIIKGGKRVKVNLVRRTRKKRLTAKQRMAARRGAMKRRAHKAQSARKRRKSLALRKRMHIKSPKLPKSRLGYKFG